MRRLFPTAADEVDLDAAYWVPDPGEQLVAGMMIGSVDGAAQSDGRSGGLGNAADKQLFALMRAHAEVLLVGASTVRVEGYGGDRPSREMVAVRRRHYLGAAPRMAVLTNRAELDPEHPLFTDTLIRPLVITSAAAPADRVRRLSEGAEVITAGDQRVDVGVALDELKARGLTRVSCEGGPNLLGQVAAAGRLDELRLTVAPLLLAGPGSRIITGPELDPVGTLDLVHILEHDSYLFLRYRAAGR